MDNLKKAWEIFVKKGVINRELIDEKIGYSWAKSKLMGLNPFTSFNTVIMSDMDIASKKTEHEGYSDIVTLLVSNVDYLKENFDVYLVDTEDDIIFDEVNVARSSNFFKLGMKVDEKSIGTTAYNIFKVNKVISILRGPEHFYSIMHNLTSIAFEINDSLGIFAVGPFMDMDQDRIKKLIDLKNKIQNYKNESSFESDNSNLIDQVFDKLERKILIFDDRLKLIKSYGFREKINKFDDFFIEKSIDEIRINLLSKEKYRRNTVLNTINDEYFEVIKMDKVDDLNVIVGRKLDTYLIDYSKVELFYDEIEADKINILVNFNDEIKDNIMSSFLSKIGKESLVISDYSNSNTISIFAKTLNSSSLYSNNLYYSNDPFEIMALKSDNKGELNIIDGISLVQKYNISDLSVNLFKGSIAEDRQGDNFSVNTFTNIENIEDAEKLMIEKVIVKNGYNFTKASVELGIGRSTLYRKMKKYGIKSKK